MIKRQYIWPVSIRLTHGLIALSVLGLLITGTALQYLPQWYDAARDYHSILGYCLTLAVVYRLLLFFIAKNNAANWRQFRPGSLAKSNFIAMLRFYVTFGRTPLPNWYAHNPFWLPLYLLVFLALILLIGSGFFILNNIQFTTFDIVALHHHISRFVFWFTIFHFIAVIAHDIKGTGSDISAILNGFRIFIIDKTSNGLLNKSSQKVSFPPKFIPQNKNKAADDDIEKED